MRKLVALPTVAVAAALLLGGGCGGDDAPSVRSQPIATSGDVEAQIDVGDRALHVECHGAAPADGEPTVVLEAGLGGTTSNWANVMLLLPEDLRVCAYDRAGLGRSDPAPGEPRSAADLASDLDLLLRAAEIEPPYLLVAHSLGPWVSTLYAASNPDAVAGMVLVDPRAADISDGWIADANAAARDDPTAKELVSDLRAFNSNPAANDEGLDINASQAEVGDALRADRPLFGDMPLVVLAGTLTPTEFPDVVRVRWTRTWRAGLRSFLTESTAGRIVPVDSGHMITDDAPDAIVDAILSTLADR